MAALIHNTGLIVSEDRAIEVFTAAGQTTVVVNAAKGTIHGADDAIRVDGGNIVLTNLGTLTGDVEASVLEKDVVVNNGTINGNLFLGGGDDLLLGQRPDIRRDIGLGRQRSAHRRRGCRLPRWWAGQ